MKKFISRVQLPLESYFMEYMQEFSIVPKESILDDVLNMQQSNLEKNAENPENFKKLQIIKNLKDAAVNATSAKQMAQLRKIGIKRSDF